LHCAWRHLIYGEWPSVFLHSDNTLHCCSVNEPRAFLSSRGRASGGLLITVRARLKPTLVNNDQFGIAVKTTYAYFLTLYFPPNYSIEHLIETVMSPIVKCNDTTLPIVIDGDFNCRLDTPNDRSNALLEALETAGLTVMN